MQDPKSAEIIKPFALGKDIHKWEVDQKDRWLIFTRRGVNIKSYPAIERASRSMESRIDT